MVNVWQRGEDRHQPANEADPLHAHEIPHQNAPLPDGTQFTCFTSTKVQILTGEEEQGTLVVARDIAHAKLKERLDEGKGLPDYVKNHLIYDAGPAKTPEGISTSTLYIHVYIYML